MDLIVDDGASSVGVESTIVDCTGDNPIILRPGYVTKDDIQSELRSNSVDQFRTSDIKFSGSFEKHYAPACRIILNPEVIEGAGFLALFDFDTPTGMKRIAAPKTVEEFARVLYSTFRSADRMGFSSLVVLPPLGAGIALAIRERLEKASRGR